MNQDKYETNSKIFYDFIEKIGDIQNQIVRDRLDAEYKERKHERSEANRIHDQLLGKAKFWSLLPGTKKSERFIPEETDIIVEAEYEPA